MREIRIKGWDPKEKVMIGPFSLGDVSNGKVGNKELVIRMYTGKDDKHGEGIYEGDIVVKDRISGTKGTIVWFEGAWWVNFINTGIPVVDEPIMMLGECEIVGNIFENKDNYFYMREVSHSSDLPKASLTELNDANNASVLTYRAAYDTLHAFAAKEEVIGVQMGIAYGGGIERVAKLWKGNGTIYGYDTFEGHPKHLAVSLADREATCMDVWYDKRMYGTDKLSYEYQRGVLDKEGCDNAILVKGLVDKNSCRELPKLHYAFLDMDILLSMQIGYDAVKDKLVPGGFLLLHDVVTPTNLPLIHDWYREDVLYKDHNMWEIESMYPESDLAILRKRP